ncbi:hypothetical protein F5B20DRAFT_559731 [Whalleya microplaca]|nr:hypothetical protein F5B20DRAFT_559731 [Whalleya microplaca]
MRARMITIISEQVLEAAREMNRRDNIRIKQLFQNAEQNNTGTDLPEVNDDEIWSKYEGIEGPKGIDGQPVREGGSYYSYGPYPRNRRILADIALAAGWKIGKARIFEWHCIERMARHSGRSLDLSDPNQPKLENGRPVTFQHISWSFLSSYIIQEVKEMDPTKLAVVKAAVLDLYEPNSKTGKKVFPSCACAMEPKSDEVPVCETEIERAQEELDNEERHRKARIMQFTDKTYAPPEKVKLRIKAFLKSNDMSEEQFCELIDVTKDQFEAFMSARKKQPQLESKVFHNALTFTNNQKEGGQPARKRRRKVTDVEVSEYFSSSLGNFCEHQSASSKKRCTLNPYKSHDVPSYLGNYQIAR